VGASHEKTHPARGKPCPGKPTAVSSLSLTCPPSCPPVRVGVSTVEIEHGYFLRRERCV